MFKLAVYLISLMLSIFGISGININHIFKKGHVNEARCFYILIIISLTYLVSEFIFGITSINLFPNL